MKIGSPWVCWLSTGMATTNTRGYSKDEIGDAAQKLEIMEETLEDEHMYGGSRGEEIMEYYDPKFTITSRSTWGKILKKYRP